MRKQWRCFHCDEVFTSRPFAAEHFGADGTPACKITSYQGHLVTYIRQLEDRIAQYQAEDSHVMRAIQALEAEHQQALRREEEKGYERGVRDMKALGYRTEAAA
jgi:hypothetical protein